MTPSAVLVTGAAGMVGRAVVDDLTAHGQRVVRLVRPNDDHTAPADPTFVGDAADQELVTAALQHAVDLAGGGRVGVVHLAAMPSPKARPRERVFTNNTAATFGVLEAAGRAGVQRAVIASSVSALGLAFGRDTLRPAYLPVDEEHPTLAEDPYALAKMADEATARMMHRRWGIDVVALRLPFVGHGERMKRRIEAAASDPGALRGDLWGWLHTRDAARAFRLALSAPLRGAHVVTVAAPDTVCIETTDELIRRYLPGVPVTTALANHTTLYDLTRAATLLDFAAVETWRPHDHSGVETATVRS